jgi:hypothetical protein
LEVQEIYEMLLFESNEDVRSPRSGAACAPTSQIRMSSGLAKALSMDALGDEDFSS